MKSTKVQTLGNAGSSNHTHKQGMAVHCKACGNESVSKSCKALAGAVYRSLYDLFFERTDGSTPTAVHQFLSRDPSVVCKVCFSTLTKYANIQQTLKCITYRLQREVPSVSTVSHVRFLL